MAEKEVIVNLRAKTKNSVEDVQKLKTEIDNTGESIDNLADKSTKAKTKTKGLSDTIDAMPQPVRRLKDGFDELANGFKAIIASPIGLILTGVAAAIGVLIAAFRTFSPLVDAVEDSFSGLSAAFSQGLKNVRNFLTGNSELNKSLSQSYELGKLASQSMREYEDAIDGVNLKSALFEKSINIILRQAKNENLSYAERNKLLEKSLTLQNQQIKVEEEHAQKRSKSLILAAMAAGATAKQIVQIQKGTSLQDIIGLDDEKTEAALKAYQQYLSERVSMEQGYEARRERITNLIDANENNRIENNKKKLKDEEDAAKKREELEAKRLKDKQAAIQAEKDSLQSLIDWQAEQDKNDTDAKNSIASDAIKRTRAKNDDIRRSEIETQEAIMNARIKTMQLTGDIFGALSSLAGENEQASKSFALMQIAADTAMAITSALASSMSPKSVDNQLTGGISGVVKFLTISGIILTNAARAKNILTSKSFSGISSGAGITMGAPTVTNAPAIVRPTSSMVNLDGQSVNAMQKQRVYVLESDITNTQNKVQNIQQKAIIK